MPELPEVETIRRDIEWAYAGAVVKKVEILEPRLLQNCTQATLSRRLKGQVLMRVGRRGKFLVFDFGPFSTIVHLRMSGWFSASPGNHTRMIVHFSHKPLYFDDTRRFATLHLVDSARLEEQPPLRGLGLEPLAQVFSSHALHTMFQTTRETKRLLLDQTKIAGLGNIYACEALFRAGVHPFIPANRVSSSEVGRLRQAIITILTDAIDSHGSSLGSAVGNYRTLEGAQGGFQDKFYVYGREHAPCMVCQTPIQRRIQAQRSTFFCRGCQRLG